MTKRSAFPLSTRRITLLAALAGALAVGAPALSYAHGGGAHGGGHAHFSHTSSKTTNTNSNGPNSTDRDKGHARAEDRMNSHGLAHNHAGITDSDDTTARTTGH